MKKKLSGKFFSLTLYILCTLNINTNTIAVKTESDLSSNTTSSQASVSSSVNKKNSTSDDTVKNNNTSSQSEKTEVDGKTTKKEDNTSTVSSKEEKSTNQKNLSSNSSSSKSSSSKSTKNSNNKSDMLLPKTKVDDTEVLDSNELKLMLDQNTQDDFGFIQDSDSSGSGGIEWIKVLGIIFIILACAGFTYTLVGLISLYVYHKKRRS